MFAKLENDVSKTNIDHYLNSPMDDNVLSNQTNKSLNYNNVNN